MMSGDGEVVPQTTNGLAPLLRWAGSKRKLLPELLRRIPESYGRYIEPFSGSACLFFALQPKKAVLSDINAELIEMYAVLRAHPIVLYKAVTNMPRTERFYYRLRDECDKPTDDIAKAARFVYLNRHCFNGVYRTNRLGHFNVPRGKRFGAVPERQHFLRCSRALKSANLVHADFEEVLSDVRAGDFVYLDPPYAKVGSRRRGEYGCSSFDTPDLRRLGASLRLLDKKKAIFLLSYANCGEIKQIKSSWHSWTIPVRRHVAGFNEHRAIVEEVLVSNAPG